MLTSKDQEHGPHRGVSLRAYRKPTIPGNRGVAWRGAWYLANALLQSLVLSLLPSPCKAAILRFFGASVGRGLVIKPRVSIKYPWFLEIGDDVWIGEGAWIDNHCRVTLESDVCISQGAYLFTGNHDWSDPAFAFFAKPVRVEAGAWIGAGSIVCPGSTVGRHAVLAAGGVLSGPAEARTVYAGNPARAHRPRNLREG